MHKILTPALIVCCLLAAAALPCPAQQPPDAHELAARIGTHYNRLHSLRLNFTESFRGMGMSRTESGTLLLAKPNRMRWDYAGGKFFLVSGEWAYSWAPGDGQVQKMRAKELDDLRSPMSLLLGRTHLEKELANPTVIAAGSQWRLTGTVPALKDRVDSLTLTASADGALSAIEIVERDGSRTHFSFSAEQDNPALPTAGFELHTPTGVPVIELKR